MDRLFAVIHTRKAEQAHAHDGGIPKKKTAQSGEPECAAILQR